MNPMPEEIRDMEHQHIKMSYNQITDLIYAGNNMCCQVHFNQEIISKGITTDISLEAESLDNPKGVKYFFWFPWEEDAVPSDDLIDLGMRVLDDILGAGNKVYIHCKNGHGRTTTFLVCYFIYKHRFPPEIALKKVFEKRPSGHLNVAQKGFLRKYAERLEL